MSPTSATQSTVPLNPRSSVPLTATRIFRVTGILLVLLFATIYVFTLDTGLQPHELEGGDLITHQYAQVQARPSNAPGYPIYTMGGWLWFHGWHGLLTWLGHVDLGHAYPNPMPILSSYSTLWALLALWLLYQILGYTLDQAKPAQPAWWSTAFSLLLTAFFGVTYFFWYYATTTEQYSSAVAQTLAIIYVYLLWDAAPARRSRLYFLALLCGLSLAHMLTVALIVPPLVAVVLWRDPGLLRRARAILFSIVAALLPLLSYIYVYIRGALNPNWWGHGDWPTPQAWFWSFVSTAQGRDELAWAFEPGRPFWGNGFPETIWHELSLPLLTLGIVGIAFLPRRHSIMCYGTLLLYASFCWLYRFGNWFQVIIPAYPLILIGLAPLFGVLLKARRNSAQVGRSLVLAALLLACLWRVNASLPAANSRHRAEDTALYHAARLLDQPLPHDARLFAAVDDALAISYLTDIWGIRPDIKTINSRDASDDLSDGDHVFATHDATPTLLDEVETTVTLDSLSPDWVDFVPTAALHAADITPTLTAPAYYTITPALILADYQVTPAPTGAPLIVPSSSALDVRLTWLLPTGVWPADVAISLRPTHQGVPQFDPASGAPLQQDRPRPIDGIWRDTPISLDTSNPVVVHDSYRLPQPAALAHTADGLLLILYTQGEGGFTNLAEISLPLPAP